MQQHSQSLGSKVLLLVLGSLILLGSCSEKSVVYDPNLELALTDVVLKDPVKTQSLGSGKVHWTQEETQDGYFIVKNEKGATLAYSKESGVSLIQVDGFAFKDLNKNGLLDQYEDWRLDVNTRALNLAKQMSNEQIAGLMLFSAHQYSVTDSVSDAQKAFLTNHVRAVLSAASMAPVATQAKWNNAVQAFVEGLDFGIPVNISSDPRTANISVWPSNLGLAATFDPEISLNSGKILSKEYRALGIGTYLGPQTDLATEPRWIRANGTFGEDPALSRDMVRNFIDGLQSSFAEDGSDLGWGKDSMNGMIKHWPGDGAAEGGREAHSFVGKFQVYPGGQFNTALIPFVDGGFALNGKTRSASAVMSSYSIASSDNGTLGEAVGSAFSKYKIDTLLRGKYGYEGVVCTDWGVTFSPGDPQMNGLGMPWGVEKLSPEERILKALKVGVNQFGGVNDSKLVLDACALGEKELGSDGIRSILENSAVQLLKNYFKPGLFENPYVDVEYAQKVVASPENLDAGYKAQLNSIVMVKNTDNAIKAASSEKPTVYIPMVYFPEVKSFFGNTPAEWRLPVSLKDASKYFNVVTDKVAAVFTGPQGADGKASPSINDIVRVSKTDLESCDMALLIVRSPINPGDFMQGYGYDFVNKKYIPLSRQYSTYTADSPEVRTESLAGDPVEKSVPSVYGAQIVTVKENRSYFGNSTTATNKSDLDLINYVAGIMPEHAKVVVAVNSTGPMIFSEFEKNADAILVGFDVDNAVMLEIVAGNFEPNGLLPMQMPKDMNTVEAQYEDVPRDMTPYVDSEGNTYDFAFGLNWSGIINDARVAKYSVPALVNPENSGAAGKNKK